MQILEKQGLTPTLPDRSMRLGQYLRASPGGRETWEVEVKELPKGCVISVQCPSKLSCAKPQKGSSGQHLSLWRWWVTTSILNRKKNMTKKKVSVLILYTKGVCMCWVEM